MANDDGGSGGVLRRVGMATRDVTPTESQFLFGYPHVARMSTGAHDPLLASAIFLDDGVRQAFFIAVDIIWLSKQQVQKARQGITLAIGVPMDQIMITATHTHSGPVTLELLSTARDPVVPEPDSDYLDLLVQNIIESATEAFSNAQPAMLGFAVADATGIGTNRHDPSGPSYLGVPLLVARGLQDQSIVGLMCVCSMHPTVLHEDSTMISGDFPAYARKYLQAKVFEKDCPIVYHMGAAGNQSPRHVTRSNTIEEVKRLGTLLGLALEAAMESAEYVKDWTLRLDRSYVELPRRSLPSLQQAEIDARKAKEQLEQLRQSGANRTDQRTAECNCFGAEETVELARCQIEGQLDEVVETCMPAEIQLIGIGSWTFVGWPGEVFTEFALQVRDAHPTAFPITLANGELQGYLVTADAVRNKVYEASNAIFASPDSGDRLVAETLKLLQQVE